MEFFKLLNLSFGIKADFSKIYEKLAIDKKTPISDLSLDVLGMHEKHVLFVKKGQENEIVYVLFNQPNMNNNFSLQRYALTYNERPNTPEETNLDELKQKISNVLTKISVLMQRESLKFISYPFFHIELVYFDNEKDYAKLLTKKVFPIDHLENSNLMKSTLGFTLTKKIPNSDESNYVLEILVEHWLQNKKFLFISGTAQWNIIEYQYKNLDFFKLWLDEIYNSAYRTIIKLEEVK
ncbi:hypothetical protein SU69_07540 [Thermosipho melanesiensis]|uniref:Uncharacterized protein n=2 Tax=Thermosipho melanesiensis TaxID=46541 RepID=A6LN29_THEM4|nr:hypothetical protein [Thermosipho melanesiensis]ABR31330.1 hypothetical protein Tmel_1483 [Thermosipho melanesiensis BI429]APT74924.1 hypothetical protein BW47_07895 [Thermosipho melanesiensis]OOC36353.1 hypothetical protein SU68_07610 [Thermosipho melanesiensis]OOC37171.1 hypothetical protein SU69_07540 [Thermosipho melanesiensis]OOC37923.1 hypothetical protein SU70_07550 [Thermosipho melanesiensis]